MKIDLVLNVNLPVIALRTKPEAILALMKQHHVRSLPVVENGQFLGMIPDETLLGIRQHPTDGSGPVKSIRSLIDATIPTLTLDSHVAEAIRLFKEANHDVLPVVGPSGAFIGAVLEKELMDVVGELLSVYEHGSVLELQFAGHDFALADVVKTIEDNQARIMSLNAVPTQSGAGRHTIEMKLNVLDATRIRAQLSRAGYSVRVLGDEDQEDQDLRDRIQELLKYIEP